MTAPARLSVPVDLTGLDADAAHRDGESAALAVILQLGEIGGVEHATHAAIGMVCLAASVVAGYSRDIAANILTDLGTAYQRAAEADAGETRH